MWKLLLVAVGGGTGAALRYLLTGWIQQRISLLFPAGTLAVNLIGCLAIGAIAPILLGPLLMREEYRLFLVVGVLGGFTTFSAFGWETFSLLNGGQMEYAVANAVASNVLGVLGVWIGFRVSQAWYGV